MTFESNGQIAAGDTGTSYPSLKYVPIRVKTLLDEFPLAEMHDAAERTSGAKFAPAYAPSLLVSYRDGRSESAFPIYGRLEEWAEAAAYQATRAFDLPRENEIASALRQDRVRFIKLEMLGCFGSCPRYDVTFRSNGTAQLRLHDNCEKTANAVLPFVWVTEAASRAGSASLRPLYSMRVNDTEGARITIGAREQTYVSEGPDSTTWGPEFLAAVSRFDQLARDATWVPRVDFDRC